MSKKETLLEKIKKKDVENKSNKVFGIGLPKTGTTSLTEALEKLGYKTYHWPVNYIHQRMLAIPPRKWDNCPHDFNIVDHWDALTNFGEHIYPSLDKDFPNSKFILTIRDKEYWLDSIRRQIDIEASEDKKIITINNQWASIPYNWLRRMHVFGCVGFDKDVFSHLYDTHYRNILYYFRDRPDDLLVMDICSGDGWDKLCNFLGCNILLSKFPDENKGVGTDHV